MKPNGVANRLRRSVTVHRAEGLLAELLDVPIEQGAAGLAFRAEFADTSLFLAAQQVLDEHERRVGGEASSDIEDRALAKLRQRLDQAASPLTGSPAAIPSMGSSPIDPGGPTPEPGRPGPEPHPSVEGARWVSLGGPLRANEVTTVVDYCDRLGALGLREVHMEMGAVTDCDRDGLNGLRLLDSAVPGLKVELHGLRSDQFTVMLSVAPAADVQALGNVVQELLDAAARREGPPPHDDNRPSRRAARSPTRSRAVRRSRVL